MLTGFTLSFLIITGDNDILRCNKISDEQAAIVDEEAGRKDGRREYSEEGAETTGWLEPRPSLEDVEPFRSFGRSLFEPTF